MWRCIIYITLSVFPWIHFSMCFSLPFFLVSLVFSLMAGFVLVLSIQAQNTPKATIDPVTAPISIFLQHPTTVPSPPTSQTLPTLAPGLKPAGAVLIPVSYSGAQSPSLSPASTDQTRPAVTLTGAGGFLTPEPFETGSPASPVSQQVDPLFYWAVPLIVIVALILSVGVIRNNQHKSVRR